MAVSPHIASRLSVTFSPLWFLKTINLPHAMFKTRRSIHSFTSFVIRRSTTTCGVQHFHSSTGSVLATGVQRLIGKQFPLLHCFAFTFFFCLQDLSVKTVTCPLRRRQVWYTFSHCFFFTWRFHVLYFFSARGIELSRVNGTLHLFTTIPHEKSTFWITLRNSHPFLWTVSFYIFLQTLTFSLVLLLPCPPLTRLCGIGPHCGRSWISLLARIMEWAVKMIKDSSNIPPLGGGRRWEKEIVQDRERTEAARVSNGGLDSFVLSTVSDWGSVSQD